MATTTGHIDFTEGSAPSTPATTHWRVYAKTDGLYYIDDAGVETGPLTDASGSGGIPETLIDAAGDLIVGSAADTAARLAVGASGTVPTSNGTTLAYAVPPGTQLDYAEKTTNTSVTATGSPEDAVVTGAGFTSDGTAVIVEFYAYAAEPSNAAAARNIQAKLYLDGTELGVIAYVQTPAAAVMRAPMYGRRKITPSAGSRTFAIKAIVSAGTGTIYAGAGSGPAGMPCYIRVTKA